VLERYFKVAENQSTVRRELLGGLTTFMTMAYIIVVNPQILAQAGMPAEGVLFATCISAAAAKLETGLVINVPPFVNTGDKVKVDTSEARYIQRLQ
jgi:AGZA family xanthine/uracil permease-like MFS transporter